MWDQGQLVLLILVLYVLPLVTGLSVGSVILAVSHLTITGIRKRSLPRLGTGIGLGVVGLLLFGIVTGYIPPRITEATERPSTSPLQTACEELDKQPGTTIYEIPCPVPQRD